MLDDDLQTVGEKGNLDVSVGAVFQRMVNGAYAEFALERRSASAARSAHTARWDLRRSGWSVASNVRHAVPLLVPGVFSCPYETGMSSAYTSWSSPGLSSFTLGARADSPLLFVELLFVLLDLAFRSSDRIEDFARWIPHLPQSLFARNAAIHHPHPFCSSIDLFDLVQKPAERARSPVLPSITS